MTKATTFKRSLFLFFTAIRCPGRGPEATAREGEAGARRETTTLASRQHDMVLYRGREDRKPPRLGPLRRASICCGKGHT